MDDFMPTYTINSNQNVLAALSRQGVKPETQCKQGFCGACRARLVKGRIKYTQEPIAFTRKDEILLCCAVTETVTTIEIKG
jgi:ferredoxin